MDANTAFLNSDIEEIVYVEQSEGYKVPGKEDFVSPSKDVVWFETILKSVVSIDCDFDFQQCESEGRSGRSSRS